MDVAAVRAVVRKWLAGPMVPAAVVQIPRVPLTSNGKVDRGALPDPGEESGTLPGYTPPVLTISVAMAVT